MLAQAEQLLQRGSSVSGSLLPAIFAIFKQWRLTGAQQMTLLGLSNEKTLYNWKSQPEKAKLTRDLLERASYILGIYKSLELLLPDATLADQWLATPNDNPLFNGCVYRRSLPPVPREGCHSNRTKAAAHRSVATRGFSVTRNCCRPSMRPGVFSSILPSG